MEFPISHHQQLAQKTKHRKVPDKRINFKSPINSHKPNEVNP